jgi:FtsP/CotA-like multicopper oxidase with cupredoxin domain
MSLLAQSRPSRRRLFFVTLSSESSPIPPLTNPAVSIILHLTLAGRTTNAIRSLKRVSSPVLSSSVYGDPRGGRPVFAIAVIVIGVLCYGLQPARSQDRVFANPPMLSSRDGRLDVALEAAPATYTIDGHQFQGMLYNGAYIPPVWRVRLGDSLKVTLHNRLSEPTNLHFHGLGVSPLGNGDNVFLHVRPGETFTYQIKIPEKHVGLFWFHPHMHGNVDQQIIGGMSGGIIVEGSDRLYPFIGNITERVILFNTIRLGERTTRS